MRCFDGAGRVGMDGNNMNELRELVEFLKANGIAEFDVERTDLKMRIKFMGEPAAASAGIDLAQLSRLMAASGGIPSLNTALPSAAATAPTPVPEAAPQEVLHQVKSPIVGTFYESPSPGAPAFVKVGDVVEVGQVLCIIEAMKLMNEIESDVAGEVVKRVASSGQPVEYGQSLFEIRAS
jgi:acetyl-CoA carboxylase biotin carboxyl carrier protein